MIPKECFFRHTFEVDKGRRYSPLVEIDPMISLAFEWGVDSLSFIFSEQSHQQFSIPKKNLFDLQVDIQHRSMLDGDACVLFIDTRPQRKSRSMNKHCHEFLVLPEAIQGVQSKEITKFSSYETRALLKDNALIVQTSSMKGHRSYSITIPQNMLYGWEEDTQEMSFAVRYYSKEHQGAICFPIPSVLPERIPYVWPLITIRDKQ